MIKDGRVISRKGFIKLIQSKKSATLNNEQVIGALYDYLHESEVSDEDTIYIDSEWLENVMELYRQTTDIQASRSDGFLCMAKINDSLALMLDPVIID
jgi:hypothetical protein